MFKNAFYLTKKVPFVLEIFRFLYFLLPPFTYLLKTAEFLYLFILLLEAVSCVTELKKNIKGLNIFSHELLYTVYTDDTIFFLKDKISVFETLNIFHKFSLVSGLSPNTTKCEIAGIGTLKGVNVALCGMKCLNLTKETVKILGVHFSYNKKLEHEMNFQSVLRVWRT